MKLLHNKEELFDAKIKIALPLSNLDMVGSRLISNGLTFQMMFQSIFSQLFFLLLSNISELSIWAEA